MLFFGETLNCVAFEDYLNDLKAHFQEKRRALVLRNQTNSSQAHRHEQNTHLIIYLKPSSVVNVYFLNLHLKSSPHPTIKYTIEVFLFLTYAICKRSKRAPNKATRIHWQNTQHHSSSVRKHWELRAQSCNDRY